MAKSDVPGTTKRGQTYHAHVRIPALLRARYGGKALYRQSLRASDLATAKAKVAIIRATLDAECEAEARRSDLDRLVKALRPEDQAIFKASGYEAGYLRHAL